MEMFGTFGQYLFMILCNLNWYPYNRPQTKNRIIHSVLVSYGPAESQPHHFFEHTCAYARWAHMHRFLSVRLSVCRDLTKIQTRS